MINIDQTNNNNEAYNLCLENRIGRPHPHIWSFIEVIQKEGNFGCNQVS